MYPITLNLSTASIALIGNGSIAAKRLNALRENGAENVKIFSPNAENILREAAGEALIARLPSEAEIISSQVVMIADLPEEEAKILATNYRAAGKLVNVEDRKEFCDFQFASFFSRGDFGISVHTNGKSPALASVVREFLEMKFSEEWKNHLEEISEQRKIWQSEKKSHSEIRKLTEEYVKKRAWLI